MKILVSACLLGACCRYDGESKENEKVAGLLARHTLIPLCPEQLGGLATPRPPAELNGGRVLTKACGDVTEQFKKGAEETLRLYQRLGCNAAILKARSPSCGKGQVYDGTFSGRIVPGEGVTAALLRENGVPVYTEAEIDTIEGT